MKLLIISVFALLLVVSLAPQETDALPVAWFVRTAAAAGARLIKNSWYTRCNPRNLPVGSGCPSTAYGVGLSKGAAIRSAREYARTVSGNDDCGHANYFGHCQAHKFVGDRRG
jgi:hypothetical protein